MDRLRPIARAVQPWWILVVGFAVLCVYAYPGYMSYDSFDQLRQARAGVYGDWHPPAMAAMWRLVEHVVEGPFGMLVIQLAAFLAGTYLVMRRWVAPTAAAIAAVALLWFPPVGTLMAVIWKDSLMLGFLVLGLGLLLSERRGAQIAGLLAFGVASAVRHNGFTITFALVLFLFQWSSTHQRVLRYVIALAAWLVVTAGAFAVNAALTDREQHPWASTLALTDITGTLRYAPPLSDPEIRTLLDGTPLVATEDIQREMGHAFDPEDPLAIFDKHVFAMPSTDAQRDAVARAWKTVVTEYPGAYLEERWRFMVGLNCLPRRHGATQQVWVGISGDGPDLLETPPPDWRLPIQHAAARIGLSWMLRPYIYLLLIVLMTPLAIRARDRVLIALVVSVLGCEAALFFVTPAATFRYLAWLVVVAFVMAVALVAKRAWRR